MNKTTLLLNLLRNNIQSHALPPKTGPEAKECVKFTQAVIALALENKLNGMFFHVPNEIPSKGNHVFHYVQKLMGKISGTTDYIFFRNDHALLLEAKNKGNKLTESQTLFFEWAKAENIPAFVFHSAEEGLDKLKEHGYIQC
jgi:hypothetical protein